MSPRTLRTKTERAVCAAAIDCGRQTWYFEEHPRVVRELRLGFELLDEPRPDGSRRWRWARYNLSFHPRALLVRQMQAWLTLPVTGPFDMSELIGTGARLECERHWVRRLQPLQGPAFPPHAPPLFLSLTHDRFDVDAFARLPEWLRDRISASPTFLALHENAPDGVSTEPWPAEHVREATVAEQIGDHIPW